MSHIFKGFNIQYPEYEITLPQTKLTLTVRSITTDQEMRLKTSLVGRKNNLEILNQILYECIVNKPEQYDTYENFIKHLTLKDREALFAGLFHSSYGDEMEMTVQCSSCMYEYDVKLSLSKGANIKEYPGEQLEILNKTVEVPLDVVPAVIYVKEPTVYDEVSIMNNALLNNEDESFLSMFLTIDKIMYKPDPSKEEMVEIETISDKIYALKQLVPRDRNKIRNTYADNFGKYSMNFAYDTNCPSCKKSFVLGVDVIDQFFRKLFE